MEKKWHNLENNKFLDNDYNPQRLSTFEQYNAPGFDSYQNVPENVFIPLNGQSGPFIPDKW